MIKNVGTIDKAIRVIVGLFLIYFAVVNYSTSMILAIVSGIVGLALIITVFTGFCFLYKIFGVNTNKDGGDSQMPKM